MGHPDVFKRSRVPRKTHSSLTSRPLNMKTLFAFETVGTN